MRTYAATISFQYDMPRTLTRSNQHYRKAVSRLPLGVCSNFRYWGKDKTIYVDHARGSRLWDLDGNEYIDYRMGYGPAILGYADPRVDAAAVEGMQRGGVFALSTELEYTLARRISKMVPAAELVRFSNSGTEAVMTALRLARAYTGKDAHIIVEGGYHGLHDQVLWYADIKNWEPGEEDPAVYADSEGVPTVLGRLTYFTPLNDANHLEDLLKRRGDRIGAFLIEPIMGNCCSITAGRQYIRDAQALCEKYNVVMVVDEVKTGFRVARGGVQELMGFKADLCTFAKAMGNGYPIAALAGRTDIMRKIGDGVAHGGTYTGHSVALAAANRTLEILDETETLRQIERFGEALSAGMGEILDGFGIPYSLTGHPSMFGLFFSDSAPDNYRDWKDADYAFYNAMAPELHERGVLCEPDSREPWFMSAAHSRDDSLEKTLEAFAEAIAVTLRRKERKTASGSR